MSLPLAEALRLVDLRPGQFYREKVNGWTVEVRVLDDAPSPELAAQMMLEAWADLPFLAVGTVRARPGTASLPDPPVIPIDDEVSE